MANVVKEAPFGAYVAGNTAASVGENIDKLVAILEASEKEDTKNVNPYFGMFNPISLKAILAELKGIKAVITAP